MSKKAILLISIAILLLMLSVSISFLVFKAKKTDVKKENTIDVTNQTKVSSETQALNESQASKKEKVDAIVSNKQQEDIEKALTSIVVDPNNDKSAATSQEERFEKIDLDNHPFRPKYNTKVELFVSSLAIKPSTAPTTTILKNPPEIDAKPQLMKNQLL